MAKAGKKQKGLQEEIYDVCLRRGIVFPSAEIYGSAAGFYEYGPVGNAIRNNLIELWKDTFINSEDNVYEISGSTVLPESVFKASGHLDSFNDPLTQCSNCKSMFRVDHIIDEQTKIKSEGKSLDELFDILEQNGVKCSNCKGPLGKPRQFNMMFETNIGSTQGNKAYLRPETAQNIFLNFRRISHSMRATLPFGIAQIGRAYRNEISARNFLIRLREFEQMEIEMFVDPDELDNHPDYDQFSTMEINFYSEEAQNKGEGPSKITIAEGLEKGYIMNQYLGYYLALENEFMGSLNLSDDNYWFRQLQPHERAHYSQANYDLEIQFPFGVVECIGLAYRTDYDLKKHQEYSKTKLQINHNGRNIVPHVIEPSFGLTRLFYAVLLNSYQRGGREWTWFKFPNSLSPWEIVVAPLMKKDGMKEGAKQLYWELKDMGIDATYDMSGAIGKRYARADEIGIPLVITYDYDSMEKDTVTVRERNSMKQIRVSITELGSLIKEFTMDLISWDDLIEEFGLYTSK